MSERVIEIRQSQIVTEIEVATEAGLLLGGLYLCFEVIAAASCRRRR